MSMIPTAPKIMTVEYATPEEERKYQEAQQEGQGVGNRQHGDSS